MIMILMIMIVMVMIMVPMKIIITIITLTIRRLLIDLKSDTPEDLIAASSYCSDKLPKVIIEASKTVNGITKGSSLGE